MTEEGSRLERWKGDTGSSPAGRRKSSGDSERRLSWYIARRYLASGRRRGFLSLITLIAVGGVTVGVMALVVVTGVMTGLQNDLRDKILGASAHGMVLEIGDQIRMEGWEEVLEKVRASEGVVAAAPFIYTEVGLNAGGSSYSEGAVLRGLGDDAAARAVTGIEEHLLTGRMPFGETETGRPGLVVGSRLADRLGLYPGRQVTVISFQDAELTPTGLMPRMRRFEVTGVFQTGLYQYDSKFAYVHLPDAQDLLGMGAGVTGVEFNVRDPWEVGPVASALQEDLGFPYAVSDWRRQNESLFAALELERIAMTVILLLIVLVAAFNIVSTLIMVVSDKTREIGILRAMGVTSHGIQRIFMLQGTVVGLVGTALGLGLGGILAWALERYEFVTLPADVYHIDRLPVELVATDVGLIAAAAVLIAFLATIYPARRAAELVPVEAIRHE